MLSCHCLNVIIETGGEARPVTSADLRLGPEESDDAFFKDARQVEKLLNIAKNHSGLVQSRNVGAWVIHYCLNCEVHSHALHRDKGASCVLVNSKLLSEESIEKLRGSERFSKLFKIVINDEGSVSDEIQANSYLPLDVDNVVKSIKQVAANGLKTEAIEVEERIRQFSDEQYSKLSNLREKTFQEQQFLVKLVLNNISNKIPASTNSGMFNPKGVPSRLNEPLAAGSVKMSSPSSISSHAHRHTPKRQKSCPHSNSFDSEGLFELEGADDVIQLQSGSERDESDLEEPESGNIVGGKSAPPRRSHSADVIAKSLPVTIPSFLSTPQRTSSGRHGHDDDDDVGGSPLEGGDDIAASIKALAKSVHGDTVFGDLPKPRYTYI